MKEYNVPGIYGIDTRQLTKLIRKHGTMLGKVVVEGCENPSLRDPNLTNLPAVVSIKVNALTPFRKTLLSNEIF